jgi:CheY-like chemotaxis protein
MSRLQESVLTQLFQRNNIQILNEKLSQAEILLWEYDRRDSIPIGLAETLKIIYLNCPKDLPSKSNAKELFLPKPLDQRALLQYIVSFEKNAPITKEAIAKSNAELSNDKVKILIAEDNAINMKLIVMILEKMGYQAVCVENGLKAIGAFEKELFDIVLMDIQMPEMDGIEASKRIRIWFGNRPVIIALTANAMEGDKELYLKEGMDDYIAKPIQFELLQKKLTHWVKESRIRNGLSQ